MSSEAADNLANVIAATKELVLLELNTDEEEVAKSRDLLIAMLDHSLERQAIVAEIQSERGRLKALADYYFFNLFIPFRSAGGQIPQFTGHPSRDEQPHTLEEEDMDYARYVGTPRRAQARLRRILMQRDGGRCRITNNPEEDVLQSAHIVREFRLPYGPQKICTEPPPHTKSRRRFNQLADKRDANESRSARQIRSV